MPKKIMDSGFSDWQLEELPKLKDKTFLITGGNSGLGFAAAKLLGQARARVVLACRNQEKAEAAKEKLNIQGVARVDLLELDLADLSSVRKAAKAARAQYESLDGLINNAGIMQTPQMKTKDGFELQLGVNHLGPFLFTKLLLDRVEAASGRVVMVSSVAHRFASGMFFDDFMMEKHYTPSQAYGRSKLANLLFAFELDRRLKQAKSKAIALACHPGYAETQLQSTGPVWWLNLLYKVTNPLMAQSAEEGALSLLLSAAGKEAKRGGYYGPRRMGEMRGPVGDAAVSGKATNEADAKKLWQLSEKLVGEKFTLPAA